MIQFEGDQHYMYRILRSIKNRFGSTSELGIYEMMQGGLRQVSNPSELLLTEDHDGLSGVAISAAIVPGGNAGSGEHGGIRNSPALGNGVRPAKTEYAPCSDGETSGLQADGERCVPEYCGRLAGN